MAFRTFTDAQLIEVASTATYIDEIVEKLNGAGRRTVLAHLKRLDHPAFDLPRSASLTGWTSGGVRQPLSSLLTKGVERNTVNLKNRLFNEGVLERKCSACGITEWQGQPAPLTLDHIDGDRANNLLANLRILCANCHSLTDTFCGRNAKLRRMRKLLV